MRGHAVLSALLLAAADAKHAAAAADGACPAESVRAVPSRGSSAGRGRSARPDPAVRCGERHELATAPAALVNWADYHLLGLQHLVFVDNNRGEHMTAPAEAALSPYVDVGVATLVTRYRCLSFNDTFGAPQLRLIALTEVARASRCAVGCFGDARPHDRRRRVHRAAQFPESLGTVAASMTRSRLCAANVLWRNYGDAGFTCSRRARPLASAACAHVAGGGQAHRVHADAVCAAEAGSFSAGFRKGKVLLTWSMMRPATGATTLSVMPTCDGSCRSFDSDYINCAASRRAKISARAGSFQEREQVPQASPKDNGRGRRPLSASASRERPATPWPAGLPQAACGSTTTSSRVSITGKRRRDAVEQT